MYKKTLTSFSSKTLSVEQQAINENKICQKVQLRQLPKYEIGSKDLFLHQACMSFEN